MIFGIYAKFLDFWRGVSDLSWEFWTWRFGRLKVGAPEMVSHKTVGTTTYIVTIIKHWISTN